MQKAWYAKYFKDGRTAQDVVGNFDYHEQYPYENHLLAKYEKEDGLALDFGCGEGRMIRRMKPFFRRIDGVDISEDMLKAANCPGSILYLIDGQHLDGVPDDEYDLVYSTIAFQHIASYPVRMTLLGEFFRVLRPGGQVGLQTVISPVPPEEINENPMFHHVPWRHSGEGVLQTNGYADAVLTPATLPECTEDFEKAGFTGWDYAITPPPHEHACHWLYIYATKP